MATSQNDDRMPSNRLKEVINPQFYKKCQQRH